MIGRVVWPVFSSFRRFVMLFCLFLATDALAGAGIDLHHTMLREEAQLVVLDATLDVRLSAPAEEALSRGVPLTLEITTRVVRPRWWWWDAQEQEVVHQVSLRYHALSRRYVVQHQWDELTDNAAERRVFSRRDTALRAWGEIGAMPVMRRHALVDEDDRYLEVRARISIEALPHPLRTVAYVSPEWRMVSDWTRLELP